MLNCILGMVDKTKRALSILQQRTIENKTMTAATVAAGFWTARGRPVTSSERDRSGPLLSPVSVPPPHLTNYHHSQLFAHKQQPQHLQAKQLPPPTALPSVSKAQTTTSHYTSTNASIVSS